VESLQVKKYWRIKFASVSNVATKLNQGSPCSCFFKLSSMKICQLFCTCFTANLEKVHQRLRNLPLEELTDTNNLQRGEVREGEGGGRRGEAPHNPASRISPVF